MNQEYTYKLDNLREIYKALEIYNLQRLNQEETENQNRSITNEETGSIIKKPSTTKKPRNSQFYWWILAKNKNHGTQSHHFMTNRWENSDRPYFLGLQNHWRWWLSHEIKRHLLLGRKAITNLDSVLQSRDITLLTKVHIVKAIVFPGVMYGCKIWTIKKAECWRIDAFQLWY